MTCLLICLRLLNSKYSHADKVHISNFLIYKLQGNINKRPHVLPIVSSIGEM